MAAVESKIFHAAVVSPEAQLLEADVTAVQFPAHDGMVGILTHRAPLLTRLGTGVLRLDLATGEPARFLIAGGYAQMRDNVLTLLTDDALSASDVTSEYRTHQAAKLAALTASDPTTLQQRSILQARLAAIDSLLAK
jgi:F-type H+-transporting ATPase subunit epsilon